MPAGVVNGASVKGARRVAMIEALANGDSFGRIAQRFHCSRDVVRSVDRSEFATVSQRKERIAAQAEQIATEAANQIRDELAKGKIKGCALVPVFGVAVDKMQALRGDSLGSIRHDHFVHRITDDDIVAFAIQRSKPKPVKGTVITAPTLLNDQESPKLSAALTVTDSTKGKPPSKRPAATKRHSPPARDKASQNGHNQGK